MMTAAAAAAAAAVGNCCCVDDTTMTEWYCCHHSWSWPRKDVRMWTKYPKTFVVVACNSLVAFVVAALPQLLVAFLLVPGFDPM